MKATLKLEALACYTECLTYFQWRYFFITNFDVKQKQGYQCAKAFSYVVKS